MKEVKSGIQMLREARRKLKRPFGWTKGHYAINIFGMPVEPASPAAFRWCSVGAIDSMLEMQNLEEHKKAHYVLNMALEEIYSSYGVTSWQDRSERTKKEVIKLFDYAIEHYYRLAFV